LLVNHSILPFSDIPQVIGPTVKSRCSNVLWLARG
jgi:hypothetical protein